MRRIGAAVLVVLVGAGALVLAGELRDESPAIPEEVRRTFGHMQSRSQPTVDEPRLVADIQARNGRRVSMWAARAGSGWCYLLRYQSFKDPDAHFGQGGCTRGSGFDEEFHSFVGGALFAGRVQPAVATLDAFFTNWAQRGLPVAEGFYLFDAPDGSPIIRLVGRDDAGRAVLVRTNPSSS
jgi:hypothetical protein